jgi:hypothetical protein
MPKIGQGRVYILSDGSQWTARQLADKLDLTTTACRYRLDQSHDIKHVMRENHKPSGRKRGSGCKTYELSDGSVMSATAIAKSMNIHPSTIHARLSRGIRDVHKLSKLPTKGSHKDSKGYYAPHLSKTVVDDIKKRNAYCPMSRLFMKMKQIGLESA